MIIIKKRVPIIILLCIILLIVISGCRKILDDEMYAGKKLGVFVEFEEKLNDVYQISVKQTLLNKNEKKIVSEKLIEFLQNNTPMDVIEVNDGIGDNGEYTFDRIDADYLLSIKIGKIELHIKPEAEGYKYAITDNIYISGNLTIEGAAEIEYYYLVGLNYKLLELSSGKEIISGEKEGYHLNKSNIKGIEPIVDSELEFEDSKSTYRLDYSKLESSKLDDIKKSIINTLLETELVLEN